jgi:uroporphyrinogen-III synthase
VAAERPLAGLRVLVTRPAHQAERLAALLEAQGAEAVRFPTIEIAPPQDLRALEQLIDRLDEFDVAIFVSANAVDKAIPLIRARRADLPARLQVACVGSATASALARLGIKGVSTPTSQYDSESLLALPLLAAVQGKRIVIFRGQSGRELLGDTLRTRGAQVEYAECYRRVAPTADPTPLLRHWVDVVTATSVEGLTNLFAMLGAAGHERLRRTPVMVVSERMAQTCRELGFGRPAIIARSAGDEAIVQTLRAWRASEKLV